MKAISTLTEILSGYLTLWKASPETQSASAHKPLETKAYMVFYNQLNNKAELSLEHYFNGESNASIQAHFSRSIPHRLGFYGIFQLNQFDELKAAYFNHAYGPKSAYVFHLGYDKDIACKLIRKGLFHKVIIKAENLKDIYLREQHPDHPIEIIENSHFDSNLSIEDPRHYESCHR